MPGSIRILVASLQGCILASHSNALNQGCGASRTVSIAASASGISSWRPTLVPIASHVQFAHRIRTKGGRDLPSWTPQSPGSGVC
jgi:hypothetical protein